VERRLIRPIAMVIELRPLNGTNLCDLQLELGVSHYDATGIGCRIMTNLMATAMEDFDLRL